MKKKMFSKGLEDKRETREYEISAMEEEFVIVPMFPNNVAIVIDYGQLVDPELICREKIWKFLNEQIIKDLDEQNIIILNYDDDLKMKITDIIMYNKEQFDRE